MIDVIRRSLSRAHYRTLFVDVSYLFAQFSLKRMRGNYSGMVRARNSLGYDVYWLPPKNFRREAFGPEGQPLVPWALWKDNITPPMLGGKPKDTL